MTHNGNMELDEQVLNCYASGDGALHFTWMMPQYPHSSSCRKVKRWHILRFFRTKEGKRLANQGWKLYNINTFWQLVKKVDRKNKNTLCMDGECYTYKIDPLSPRDKGHVWDCDFTVYGKNKYRKFEVKNWSIRACLLFFLNHEKELRRADEKGVVNYG